MASYDFIIVGGGTAGLVLAARLTEDSSKKVLVLEAGEDLTGDARVSVPAMWPTLLNTDADWKFKTIPQPGLNNRAISFPQGKVLGGSSAINGLSFTHSSKANVDAWFKLGNPGWDWASFSESLAKAYTLTSPSADVTGSGPLQLSYPKDTDNVWPSIWQQTLEGLGFPKSEDTTKQSCGPIFVPDTIHPASKTRSYAGNAYLEPARSRENLTVIPKAAVSRILFDRTGNAVTATGIEYIKDNKTQTAAGKEIILTAGTINSPRLLELSGIGDAKRLEKLGIEVIVNNPNVGENLQNHPMCGLSFEAQDDEKTMDGLARQDPAALQAAMAAYAQQLGPFASSGTNNAAQLPFPGIKTAEGKAEVEQLISKYITSAKKGDNAAFVEAQADFVRSILTSPDEASGYYISFPGYAAFNPDGTMAPPPPGTGKHFSIALLLTHPLSRGSVHITSATDVAIDPRYFSHPLDIEVLARHLGFVESIASAQPLASHLKAVEKRNAAADQAKEYLRQTAVGAHHFTGTCSMMPEALGGVVDAQLRVYGVSNLRIADASIIPLTPRANPQATVYGVAEHAAAIIKGQV
ncbi:GMC oxidoreductase [Trichoderma longibrachiatum]|uniref:GMC oxidoreductase n=1 Tax=Trichoderma longibrachiatum ATCC 18648 TaxID=983965 RepID=A0A2T4C0Z6_TRILO|nr:GMC oxidoreductase [Trichoderma longibrachiatum ATCC 18648]